MEPVSIDGVVEAQYSERGAGCICCPGNHRFGIGIKTDPFVYPWGKQKRTSVYDWLNMHLGLSEPGVLDGKRVRVTLEVLDG